MPLTPSLLNSVRRWRVALKQTPGLRAVTPACKKQLNATHGSKELRQAMHSLGCLPQLSLDEQTAGSKRCLPEQLVLQ